MKQGFTIKSLIGSLLFPIVIGFVFGIPLIIIAVGSSFNVYFELSIGCALSVLLGGILPIMITIGTETSTSSYLKDRSLSFLGALILITIAWLLDGVLNTTFIMWCTLFLSDVLLTLYYIKIAKSGTERLIICISNPILYFTIILVCFVINAYASFCRP